MDGTSRRSIPCHGRASGQARIWRFLAVAVGIQQTSGGNLAEIPAGSGQGDPRAAIKLFRKVKAITAEAKWSGTFLSVFPRFWRWWAST